MTNQEKFEKVLDKVLTEAPMELSMRCEKYDNSNGYYEDPLYMPEDLIWIMKYPDQDIIIKLYVNDTLEVFYASVEADGVKGEVYDHREKLIDRMVSLNRAFLIENEGDFLEDYEWRHCYY